MIIANLIWNFFFIFFSWNFKKYLQMTDVLVEMHFVIKMNDIEHAIRRLGLRFNAKTLVSNTLCNLYRRKMGMVMTAIRYLKVIT